MDLLSVQTQPSNCNHNHTVGVQYNTQYIGPRPVRCCAWMTTFRGCGSPLTCSWSNTSRFVCGFCVCGGGGAECARFYVSVCAYVSRFVLLWKKKRSGMHTSTCVCGGGAGLRSFVTTHTHPQKRAPHPNSTQRFITPTPNPPPHKKRRRAPRKGPGVGPRRPPRLSPRTSF